MMRFAGGVFADRRRVGHIGATAIRSCERGGRRGRAGVFRGAFRVLQQRCERKHPADSRGGRVRLGADRVDDRVVHCKHTHRHRDRGTRIVTRGGVVKVSGLHAVFQVVFTPNTFPVCSQVLGDYRTAGMGCSSSSQSCDILRGQQTVHLRLPRGITTARNGVFFVSDSGNGRILRMV
jgi:hypothetical protein